MKLNKYILACCTLISMASCETDFLQRRPLTEVTEDNFFKTINDLESYTNGFYQYIGASTSDGGTDNESVNTNGNTTTQIMMGKISSANIGGWDDWDELRTYNYFLSHTGQVTGEQTDVDHYIGIARFFRARFYADKVKNYSDVPWYDKALSAEDPDMYKGADSRNTVMDKVLEDLEFSVEHIKEDLGSRTRINRWAALASMARICLYEGTYRKYHPELKLENDYTRFLNKAVWACEEIMTKGGFSIYGSSGDDYRNLFKMPSLDNNPEIILQRAYDKDLGIGNDTHSVLDWAWGLSNSLAETYLMADGTRFTDLPDYHQKTFTQMFENRDPRMKATFAFPGFKQTQSGAPYRPELPSGGYSQLKFYPDEAQRGDAFGMNYTSLPIFRYAEILLIYAEAKAELGTLKQEDLENSITLIRKRVGMKALNMEEANASPDPILEKQYPNVTGPNKGVILEIRRERRVEMACEGLRWQDIQRWGAGKLYAQFQEGIYVEQFGAFDVTGDGVEDIAVLPSPEDESAIAGLPEEVRENLTKYYLMKDGEEQDIYLSEGDHGHICFTRNKGVTLEFKDPQYYYLPIPQKQTLLNPNLKQPFGWE